MNTYLWLNREGEFLYISEQTTHTGHHVKAYFTKDVNLAYVGADLPRKKAIAVMEYWNEAEGRAEALAS